MKDILVIALAYQDNINSSSASTLSANTDNSFTWILDSGASNHMTFDAAYFSTKTCIPHLTNTLTACGNNLTPSHIGHANIPSRLSVSNVY